MDNRRGEIAMGDLEAKILYAVVHAREKAYGVSIWDTIRERRDEDLAMGAIYATLDRLETKGFVRSWWSEPTAERGGRRKRLFEITALGETALMEYDAKFRRMSDGWQPSLQGGCG
jgi:DNA-binding PadR family transcriptional regulator